MEKIDNRHENKNVLHYTIYSNSVPININK